MTLLFQPRRRSRHEQFMATAVFVSDRGTCSRLNVGAVIVRDDILLSTGYNGAPRGVPHCIHQDDNPCEISVHAEINAFVNAARVGARIEGCTLYVTHAPCFDCSKVIINSGITQVVYDKPFRSNRGLELLADTKIQVFEMKEISV